jgi:hypothetical protein
MATLTAHKGIKGELVMRAETTAGVDPMGGTYTIADIIPVEWDSLSFTQDQNEIQNKMTAGLMGRAPSIIGTLTGMIEASCWFRGAGATYTASVKPEIDMWMRASGHSAVFDTTGGAKWTYKPTEVDETYTAYLVSPPGTGATALSRRLLGAQVFRLGMQADAGKGLRVSVTIAGAMDTTNADLTYVAGTLSSVTPPVIKGALFVIDDGANYVPRVSSIGFDAGIQCQYIDSINAAGAVAGTLRMDRSPEFAFVPEADLETNSGWWAMLRDGAPMNFCTFQVGTVAFNRLLFKFGANGTDRLLQLVKQGMSLRNGLWVMPSVLRATLNAAGSDYSIVAS